MRMVDLSSVTGSVEIADRPILLNCESQAGKKALAFLRALVMPLVPCCGRLGMRHSAVESLYDEDDYHGPLGSAAALGHTVTGTIYGCRKGRVTFCLQEDPKGPPLLLLEFAIPTCTLVREMSSGRLRIALECEKSNASRNNHLTADRSIGRKDGSWAKSPKSPDLLMEPVWSLFCNDRKVGYAIRRLSSEADRRILNLMQSVSMGAGVMPSPESYSKKMMMMAPVEDLMYMRARYQRVGCRSHDSLSLHLINPDGTSGQELSISLYRS